MEAQKIALVANSAFTVLNFRKELIIEMLRRGYVVLVVCPRTCNLMNGADIEAEITKVGARFVPVEMDRNSTNPFKDIAYFWRLFKVFKRESPSYVLNYTIKPAIFSSLAARAAGVRFIFSNITGLGYAFSYSGIKGRAINIVVLGLYKMSLRFNKFVFFQNPDDKMIFVSKRLVDERSTVVLNGSGVDTKKFLRASGLPSNCSFIFIGRLLRDKGIFEYIDAAKRLKSRFQSIKFTIVGQLDNNQESLSESELESLVASGTIEYLGSVRDVIPLLEDHQVFVLPSYREGTPRAILEAMSMSMPIITTDAPGCRETVQDGWNGFLVPVGDADLLFEAMCKFAVSPGLASLMGSRSRVIATERYEVKSVVGTVLSRIEHL